MSHAPGLQFEIDEVLGHLRHVDISQVEQRCRPRARRSERNDPLLAISPTVYVR
jgi:hypothetical protein